MTYHVSFPGLGFEVTVDRVAFTVFGMPIYWYGVLIALGLLLGMLYAFRNAKSYGIDADRMVDVLFVSTLAAIAGGRAYYVATAPFEYESVWQMLDIRQGGIAIYGAVIAAFAAGALMCRLRKVPMLPMFDLAAQGFLIGQCIGRWGNFVNQEAFGTNTALPWGMISEGTRSYLASVQQTLAAQGVTVDPSLPVHPTFLYESLWCGLGFLLLWRYSRRRRFHGEVLLLYVMWYGFERFFVEGLRTDSLMVGRFRVSQVLAGASVLAALALWLFLRKKYWGVPLKIPALPGKETAPGEAPQEADAQSEAPQEADAQSGAPEKADGPDEAGAPAAGAPQDGAKEGAEKENIEETPSGEG